MAMILRAVKDSRWTAINNTVLHDERLSWRARGIAAYLLTKPDDWRIDHTHLWRTGKEGRDAVLAAMKELETCGYLVRVRYQKTNGNFLTEVRLYETPQVQSNNQESDFQGAHIDDRQSDFQEPTTAFQDSVAQEPTTAFQDSVFQEAHLDDRQSDFQGPTPAFQDSVFQEPTPAYQKSVNQKSVNQDSLLVLKPITETNWLVSGRDPTNQLTNGGVGEKPVNTPAYHSLAVALLVSVNVAMPAARKLADAHPFEEIRRQVAAWLPDHARGVVNVGALIHRIETGWGCPDLSADFLGSDLYLRHRTPAEIAADQAADDEAQARIAAFEQARAAKAAAPPKRPTPSLPGGGGVSHTDVWDEVRSEIMAPQPQDIREQWTVWLEGSTLVDLGPVAGVPLYQLQLPNADGVSWVTNRMATAIRRTLSSMVQTRVNVEVIHRPDLAALSNLPQEQSSHEPVAHDHA